MTKSKMLDINNIKILYLEIVSYINNLSDNSKIKDAFMVNLPCILLDIIDIYNFSPMEWERIKYWHVDRVVKGLGSNLISQNIKLIIKQIFFIKENLKFYNPLSKKFVIVKKLIIDLNSSINYKYLYLDLCEKDLNNIYTSSSTYIFYGEIKNFEHREKVDKLVDLFIDKIFSLDFLINIEDRKIRLSTFKEKLKRSIIATMKRSKQCEKFLPSQNNKSEIHLGTLYSPFNRLIAIQSKKRFFKIISSDHGPGSLLQNFHYAQILN